VSERVLPAPRDWVASWPFPWPPTRSLPDGAAVRACFCLVDFQLARTRTDQPYLRLTLSDRHGPVEARVWEGAEELIPRLSIGSYVGVQGRIEFFNGQLQLCVESLEPLRVELGDLDLFLPRSARPQAELECELVHLIESVAQPALRELLCACLGANSEIGRGFRLAPAAKYNHHAFLGGLLEHTLSVAGVCDRLAEHYGPGVDRDLLVTAALLHDVGKVREIDARAGFPYTDEGKLLGHILLGLQIVTDAARDLPALPPARLLLLQHLIASHQGRYEWQSPREPATLEAVILHYADDLDAKLQQVRELIAQGEGSWTTYDRTFRRQFLRHLRADEPLPPATAEATARAPEQVPVQLVPPAPLPVRPAAPEPEPNPGAGGSGGAGRHRLARGQSATGFHRLSEDTLDLFGEAGRG